MKLSVSEGDSVALGNWSHSCPEILETLETQIAPQGLLDYLRIPLASSRGSDLDGAEDLFIEGDGGAGFRHQCTLAS